jgi:exonuclease SbcD
MANKSLTILHSSDWHLGHTLENRRRREDFEHFFTWLRKKIREKQVDVLLLAGDIFHSSLPSNDAQGLYYDFLTGVRDDGVCRHMVIIAGNHDSPTLLNAPATLLRALNIHVVGQISDDLDDEIIELKDPAGVTELVVGAIPYLREQDIRRDQEGETQDSRQERLIANSRMHIRAVCERAAARCEALQPRPPLVLMGHLYSSGGKVSEGKDGSRELYCGSAVHIDADVYVNSCDYVALGHLHMPQNVAGNDFIRYSGSPLAMGFREESQPKSVCLLRFAAPHKRSLELLEIEPYRKLRSIRGEREKLLDELKEMVNSGERIWLEVIYDSQEPLADLRDEMAKITDKSNTEIFSCQLAESPYATLAAADTSANLAELDPEDVFRRCMQQNGIAEGKQAELLEAYNEILQAYHEKDAMAVEGVEA